MRRITAAFLAASVLLAGRAHAQGGFGPDEMTLVPLRDNIYLIRIGAAGNTTMIVGDKAVLLIDDKFATHHDGIMEKVREVTDLPVRYVINTHMHPDHVGGNPGMIEEGADIVASQNARRIMVERQTPGLPNIVIDDFLRMYLGDMPIDLHYLGRGHTDNDIVVHLPEQRVVVTGDLFALYEPYRPVVDYSAGGSLRDWTRTLDRLLQLDFDTVIPGHSGVTDRANVEGYRDTLIETQQMIRSMVRQERTRDEIRAMLENEFHWGRLEMNVGLDGAINEMQ